MREHPLARARLADWTSDFLGKAWDKGWLSVPNLGAEELWAEAAKSFGGDAKDAEYGGRSDEDIADFRERFKRLCSAVREEADLNALGQAMAWGQLTRAVRNRLALGKLWLEKPELLETQLATPIIVIGHMRSGTTRIHKLLAADPAHSHTRYQDAYHPVPAPRGMNRMKATFELAMLGALNPWMQSIHPMAAGEVEEELAWISAALHHSIYESQWHIPSYSAWSEGRDARPIYREFGRILRTDAAHRGNAERPRVMKVPAFAENLDALLSEFPDARLVVAERERGAVLRSAISLCANQMAVQSDSCAMAQIEALWQHKIDMRDQRMAHALGDWKGPIARLHFDALSADWEAEICRCYNELDLPLSAEALAEMREVMSRSAKGHHHAHSAQLKSFERDA
ncbi:MAG: sulfotransferase [Pseudomonadota bacterium]